MNHSRLLLLTIRAGLISSIAVLGREFPVRQVSLPTCKGIPRTDLPKECKTAVRHRGQPADAVDEYGNLIFSALRGASYDNPHNAGEGSHPSLDIATAQGTSVYSIHDGNVVFAGYKDGYGNSITIEHTRKNSVLYSNYSHLETILVKAGDEVSQGDIIGEVGRSGFTMGAYGYHLDFQLTTADSPAHPYGFHDCEAGYMDAVNKGLCKDKLEAYTIDPLEFFANYADMDLHPVIKNDPEPVEDEEPQTPSTPIEPFTLPDDHEETNPLIDPASSPGNILFKDTDSLQNEYALTVEEPDVPLAEGVVQTDDGLYRIHRERSSERSEAGKFVTLQVFITDKHDEPVTASLAQKIILTTAHTRISLVPSSVSSVINGKKHIFLKFLDTGEETVTISYGKQHLGSINFSIQ